MKRRLVILLFPIFCSVFSAMLPSIIYHSAACVNIVEPTAVIYQKTISYTGEVQAASTREIYLETPVIPEEVLVEPGDRVQKGSLLATIDTQLTKSVLAQGITISSDVESSEKEKAIYEQYGKAYGLAQQEISQLLGSSSSVLSQQSGSSFSSSPNCIPNRWGCHAGSFSFRRTLFAKQRSSCNQFNRKL